MRREKRPLSWDGPWPTHIKPLATLPRRSQPGIRNLTRSVSRRLTINGLVALFGMIAVVLIGLLVAAVVKH